MSDDTSPDAPEFRCLVPFPDGSPSFVNGFESGMIWQQMIDGASGIEPAIAVHRENSTVLQRMADAQGYDCEIDHIDDEWSMLSLRRRPKKFAVIDGGRTALQEGGRDE